MAGPLIPAPAVAAAGLSWREAIGAALLVTLARPRIWPVALAGFLIRGGIVAVALPILALPSVVAIQLGFREPVADVVQGSVGLPLVLGFLAVLGGLVAWIVLGGLVGGRIDLALIGEALDEEDLAGPPIALDLAETRTWAAFTVRLVALTPLLLAFGAGAIPLVEAARAELLVPIDVATPLFVRIVADIPFTIGTILPAWLVGEALGGLAVRELAAGDASAAGALVRAVRSMLRRPGSALATIVATNLGLLVAATIGLGGAGVAWERLGGVLARQPAAAPLPLIAFVGLWLGALVLIAAAVTWRQVAWTFEAFRTQPRGSSEPPPGIAKGSPSGSRHEEQPGRV